MPFFGPHIDELRGRRTKKTLKEKVCFAFSLLEHTYYALETMCSSVFLGALPTHRKKILRFGEKRLKALDQEWKYRIPIWADTSGTHWLPTCSPACSWKQQLLGLCLTTGA